MISFDTSLATEDINFRLDGTVYTMRPMGAGEYVKLLDSQSQLAAAKKADKIMQVQERLYDIVRPMITPADRFAVWEKTIRARSEVTYRQVMDSITKLATDRLTSIKTSEA